MTMGRYHIKEASEKIGIHPSTLKRWFKEGKVRDVGRDIRGWRVFSEEEVESIRQYATRITPHQDNSEKETRI